MPNQVVGSIPKFDGEEETPKPEQENADQTLTTESVVETPEGKETETPTVPTAEETPAEGEETPQGDDTTDLRQKLTEEIDGMKQARQELLLELKDLRGQKAEAKKVEIAEVTQQIDKLEDVNQDDATLVDRIVKARGYVSKQDVAQMFLEARKQEVRDKFFTEFPEYNEQNDPNKVKFNLLLEEVRMYKEPTDVRSYETILRRAHEFVSGTKKGSERDSQVLKRRAEIAGVGTGGVQRSSSIKGFSPERRSQLQSWGWTDEQIAGMEERQSKG